MTKTVLTESVAISIQPGQLKSDCLSYVIVDLNDIKAKRFEEPLTKR